MQYIETIVSDKEVGEYWDYKNLNKVPTNVIEVCFSKTGVHFIPVNSNKGDIYL